MRLRETQVVSTHLGQTCRLWIQDNPDASTGKLRVFLDGELYLERVDAAPILKEMQAKRQIPPMTSVFVSYRDIWALEARIFPENVLSIRLHEKLGFRVVGLREKLGRMDYGPLAGTLRDVLRLERRSSRAGVD